jgi:hypothetical protein
MRGGSNDEGPLGYDPAIIFEIKPFLEIWSIPLTPYISPAAIGLIAVIFFGEDSLSNLSPIAFSTKSGHPRAEDEEMVTTAPSSISFAADSPLKTGTFRPALDVTDLVIE